MLSGNVRGRSILMASTGNKPIEKNELCFAYSNIYKKSFYGESGCERGKRRWTIKLAKLLRLKSPFNLIITLLEWLCIRQVVSQGEAT